MKKIILSLAVLFTYSVSIRFMTSGLNQDDFNNIHFSTISKKILDTHQNDMFVIQQASLFIQVLVAVLLFLTLMIYSVYNNRLGKHNKLKLHVYYTQLKLQKQEALTLNMKESLSKDLVVILKQRLKKIDNEVQELNFDSVEDRINTQLKSLQNYTKNVLQFLYSKSYHS